MSTLAPQHLALIRESAISDAVSDARGYRTIKTKAEVRRLGFSATQASAPALWLPIHTVNGDSPFGQIRPDEPRIVRGKRLKYETPRDARMAIDVPPACRPSLGDPAVPLVMTEGIRKADAGASAGLCAIDLIGVWNWRGTNEHGGKTLLADFETVAFNGREIYIAYDSDVMLKREVRIACDRLAAVMRQRGGDVRFIILPSMPDGTKQGLDNFLAAGHGVDELFHLARREMPAAPDDDRSSSPYRATSHGLTWERPTRDGTVETQLTNFTACIVADVIEDDGAETRRAFEIEAELAGRPYRFQIPAAQFAGMTWATEQLGAGAIVAPGFGTRDHARAAVQMLSGEIPTRRLYTHTGWREVDGQRVYLHAGGAIGAGGALPDVGVALVDRLARFSLPIERLQEDDALRGAVRASLGMLRLAPRYVTWPLFAATYRTAVAPVDMSMHLAGPTGAGKTELAALAQQHYGPEMDARHLPGSWDSTANALEGLMFAANNMLFVVDDFMPNARGRDADRLHRDADRLLRAVGNSSGRQRMRADTSLRPEKPPRALPLSTGEDVPRGQSLRARLLILELGPHDLDWERLTQCQSDAAGGLYALAMAGYIRWLAGRWPDTAGTLAVVRDDVLDLRARAATSAMHRRTPEVVANLAIGARLFLTYAVDVGALTAAEAEEHWRAAWNALGLAATAQAMHQAADEPAGRFIELVTSALASGRAHLAAPQGSEPETPEAWGWRLVTVGSGDFQRDEWRPQGERVGWIDGADVYLDADAAVGVARRLAGDGGATFTITRDTLGKRLAERGVLASTEDERLTVRRTLDGQRRRVWHTRMQALYPGEKSGQSGQSGPETAQWPDFMARFSRAEPESGQRSGHGNHDADTENEAAGPIGPIFARRETQHDEHVRHAGPIPPEQAGHDRASAAENRASDVARALPTDIPGQCAWCGKPVEDDRRICRRCAGEEMTP